MTGDAGDDDRGFLTRWSRRKRQAGEPREDLQAVGHPAPPPPALPEGMPAAAEPDERPRDPETGELIDEELVRSLPDVADLQPGGDLSAFMRKGVPEETRREALRAMWSVDPAIRDFVSPALDYAHDYNAPGGAPGHGPLSLSDMAQAREYLKTMFSDARRDADAPAAVADAVAVDCDVPPQALERGLPVGPHPVRRSDVAAPHITEIDPAAASASNVAADDGEMVSDTEKPQNAAPPIVQRSTGMIPSDPENLGQKGSKPAVRRRGGGASPA